MATTYKSTVEVNVWKEHACIVCGSRFRYLFKRKKTGQGRSPESAAAAARKAVLDALQNDVDMHPCPGCGLYQPDMIGSRRAKGHWWLMGASGGVVLLFLILMLADVMAASTAAWTTAAACALLGLGHLLIDGGNPNRNLERNLERAQKNVERGDLWLPADSKAEPESSEMPRFGWSTAHTVAYILFGLGLLSLASPELLRLLHGWPSNPQWHPLAAGPGDEVYIYFPDSITSVKGYWRGNATAVVVDANAIAAPGLGRLQATSQSDNWGETIHIGSKESKTSSKTLWVRVALPPDPRLEGKTLKIKMTLDVVYPQLSGIIWEPAGGHFEYVPEIRLGGAGAGSRYQSWWWGGWLGGVLLLAISSILLVRLSSGLRQLAQPTSIFTPPDEVEEAEEAEEAQEEIPEVLPADPPRRRDEDGGIVRRER